MRGGGRCSLHMYVSLLSSISFVLKVEDDEDVSLPMNACSRTCHTQPAYVTFASRYVEESLMYFVTGQYSNGFPIATMIGYVMNGDNGRARRNLRKVMKTRIPTLRLTAGQNHPSLSGMLTRFRFTYTCRLGHSM